MAHTVSVSCFYCGLSSDNCIILCRFRMKQLLVWRKNWKRRKKSCWRKTVTFQHLSPM